MERCTRASSGVDGVDILAVLEHKQHPHLGEKKVVLVLQYRPPMEMLNLEFPAGLIDEGESAFEASTRELLEETYVLCLCPLLPPYTAPGTIFYAN